MLPGCVCCYVRKNALLQYLEITEGRDMAVYEVPLYIYLLGFGYVSQFPYVLYYVVAKRRGPMCFRCFVFSLPCELLFLLSFIASWT